MNDTAWVLEYGEGPQEIDGIETVDQLDAAVERFTEDAVAEQRPFAAVLYSPDERSLTIGVGAAFSVASWFDVEAQHPTWYAAGDLNAGAPSKWYYGNQWSEFPPQTGISVDTAREALREFFQTGQCPTLRWVEV